MTINRIARLMACVVGIATATTGVLAQDSTKTPHIPLQKAIGSVKPNGPVPSLAVINSAAAKIDGEKLILTGVSANSIVFADRPVRAAGHVATEQFVMQWDEGKDSFAVDPPNATVSVLGGDGTQVSDVVVTLKSPKLEGSTLTFDLAVLEGSLGGAAGPAAVTAAGWVAAQFTAATRASVMPVSPMSEVRIGTLRSITEPDIAALRLLREWRSVLPSGPLQPIRITTHRNAATIPFLPATSRKLLQETEEQLIPRENATDRRPRPSLSAYLPMLRPR
jgi:hypothetical protein